MAKNKQKTKKIITKRFKVTKTGKIIRKYANVSHLNRKDDSSQNSRKKRNVKLKGGIKKIVKNLIV